MKNVAAIVRQRKTTKAFDAAQNLTSEQLAAVRDLLRFSPSSTNAQPWHFFIATSEAGKRRIASGATGAFAYNEAKIMNASAVVVLCARNTLDESYLQQVLDQETRDGRWANEEARANQNQVRKGYVQKHQAAANLLNWSARQVYIALGFLLLGAAEMAINACPIEGFDDAALDAELSLPAQGLKSLVLVALGHRSAQDFNAALPKSRLDEADVISML